MSLPKYSSFKPAVTPWIQEIPAHWEEKPFYALMRERKTKNKGMKEDNLLSLSYGNIIRKDINTPNGLLPESFETYQIVEPNDVVFRLTDLQNDKRSLRSAICSERGIITSAYLAVQSEGILPAFVNYLMRAYDVQKVFYSMGGGLRQSLGYEDLRRMSIVVPLLEEQVAIARFLDRETARIDGLIEKKGGFIELLKEKRAAVITHAMTKGIDPSVPMKSTCAKWIQRIPKTWDEIRAKRVFSQRSETKRQGDQQLSATQKYGVIPQNSFIEQTGNRLVLALSGIDGFRHVNKGDFVISLRSFQGGIERCFYDGCVSPAYTVLKRSRPISESFFGYLLKCDWFIAALQTGITGIREGKNVSYEEFGEIVLPIPKIKEQTAIAEFLDLETTRIDGLISTTNRSIELLKEKRSALITAAVTGKIDVRNAA